MEKIILASNSPRRKELVGMLQVDYEVITKEVDESLKKELSAVENVMDIANRKAETIASQYMNRWVIGCDTIVVSQEQILGKPKDVEDAFRMLSQLSGKMHKVYTGVSIQNKEKGINHQFYEETKVYFKVLDEKIIKRYIDTGDPLDKAGAYGIQTQGALLVKRIEGDYFNVVGLPISRLYDELKEIKAISF